MLRNKYYNHKCKWKEYTKQRNKVNRLRHKSLKGYLLKRCEGGNQSHTFWETIKPFMSDKCIEHGSYILLKEGDSIINDQNQVCEIFNSYFSNVATDIGFQDCLPNDIKPTMILDIIEKHKHHPSIEKIRQHNMSNMHFKFNEVSLHTIEQMLLKLNPKKSAGFDQIPPKLFKVGAKSISPHLTLLVNSSIQTSEFPHILKLAEVSPVYKKEDNMKRNNYRPISILSVMSKIFEITLANQLSTFFHNIFSTYLSAYRHHYSTQDVLIQFTEYCKMHLDNGDHVCAVLMDLSKAFDCIPHTLTIAKLHAYGLTDSSCGLLASY
jgi:hypothetical protein